MRSRPSACPPSRCTCRICMRARNFAHARSPRRGALVRSAALAHKATTLDWTQPCLVWKLRGALMAKQGKKTDANGVDEHELVSMARGLAEIVALQGLSELIVDTKETTITVRRGVAMSSIQPL